MKELTENEAISWAVDFWERRVSIRELTEERQNNAMQLIAGFYKSGGKMLVPAILGMGLTAGDIARMKEEGVAY